MARRLPICGSTEAVAGRAGVLVDCDGTLVDTNYLHALAWSRALRELGEWAPMNVLHRLVGMGGDHLVPEVLGHDLEGAEDAHDRHYEDLKSDLCPFPAAGALLGQLHELGLVVVLATSASASDLDQILSAIDAGDAIDAVVHADDVDASKPSPDIFERAREAGGIDPQRVVAVGDSVWDVRAARAARMPCVAVESGGSSRHELEEEGAVAVYRDVEQLGDQLLTSPVAHLIRLGAEVESR